MNKKQAIAYAQVTLDHMQSLKYKGQINPDTFAIEMKQSYKEYPPNIIISIAEAQASARIKMKDIKKYDTNRI